MRHDFVPKPPPLQPASKSRWPTGVKREFSEPMDLHARLLAHISRECPASTQEIAHRALFLAAPASSYITGHVLPIDGGLREGLLT